MKTKPFYSADPGARKVYHDSTRCREGNAIEVFNYRIGDNGYPRCAECAMLDWA